VRGQLVLHWALADMAAAALGCCSGHRVANALCNLRLDCQVTDTRSGGGGSAVTVPSSSSWWLPKKAKLDRCFRALCLPGTSCSQVAVAQSLCHQVAHGGSPNGRSYLWYF
jgi:hypothetical protein